MCPTPVYRVADHPVTDDGAGLEIGLSQLGIEAREEQKAQWLGHLSLLRKWGKAYNLVAAGEMPRLLTRHLLDSLTIHDHIDAGPVLDVGTGAGFPGVPLAILDPSCEWVLLDSAGKKVRFLRQVVRELALEHVTPVHERIERFSATRDFSTIVTRAFSSLPRFAESVRHLAGPETRLLAMKGSSPARELDALQDWVQIEDVSAVDVPGLDARRHIVTLRVTQQAQGTSS